MTIILCDLASVLVCDRCGTTDSRARNSEADPIAAAMHAARGRTLGWIIDAERVGADVCSACDEAGDELDPMPSAVANEPPLRREPFAERPPRGRASGVFPIATRPADDTPPAESIVSRVRELLTTDHEHTDTESPA